MQLPSTSQFFQTHLPSLEKYLLSKDKEQYLKSLSNQSDRKLIEILVKPLPQKYNDLFKQLKIPYNVQQELLNVKLIANVRNQNNQSAQQKLIDTLIQHFYINMQFNYTKPAQNISLNNQLDLNSVFQQKEEEPSLKLEQNLGKYLEDLVQKDFRKFKTFTKYGIKKMTGEFLYNLSYENKQHLINQPQLLRSFPDKFVVQMLIKYGQQAATLKKTQYYQQIPNQNIQSLSLSQVNLFKQTDQKIMNNPTFIRKWFQQNYLSKIQKKRTRFEKKKVSLKEMDERRKVLLKIREQLAAHNSTLLKPYEKNLFYQILILDLKRQDPSKQLFFDFIKNAEGINSFFNKQFRQTITKKFGKQSLTNNSVIRCSSLLCPQFNVDKMIDLYIRKLFKKYKNHEQLKQQLNQYLDFNIVNRIYALNKLQEGQQIQAIHDIIPKGELEQSKKNKQLTIVQQKTQKFFKADEQVALTLKIKNIKQIRLKIYEMNLQQYYLEDPYRSIDQTINLQYLNPNIQQIIQVKGLKNSHHVMEKQIVIDKIKKGYGLYIVELVGQGITSRAVIRKGAIACIQQNHIDGKLLRFYDEIGNTIQNLKIWRSGREQTISNGQYLIPFSKKDRDTINLIAVKDNFAQKIDVYIQRQSYSFDVGLIYNHQSFIVGKKAKIILHPVLKQGSQVVSIQNMQNVKISANLINNQNIKSNLKFQNVKLTDEKDYILQIPIKSYTKSISISVEGQVKDLNDNVIKLNFNKLIAIQLMQGATNFIDVYLQRTNGGNTNNLKFVGLNGQPISNMQVGLEISTLGTYQPINKQLKTNKQGQVRLGSLNYATGLKASFGTSSGRIQRSWNIGTRFQQVGVKNGTELFYAQGENILIPTWNDVDLTQNTINQNLIFQKLLDQQTGQEIYQNVISLIKLKDQNGCTYLDIKNLKEGVYNLEFLKLDRKISIRVIRGKKWPTGEIFDENSGTVFKIRQSPYNFISIGVLKQENSEKLNMKKVSIPLNIPQEYKKQVNTKQIRVHVTLKNYTDSVDPLVSGCFVFENHNQASIFDYYELRYTECQFYNNKTLSDQQAYVLNRQNQKQFIGNNFQKPRMFLKRIEVRDTTETQQQLSKEGDYRRCDDMYGGGGGGQRMMRCAKQSAMRSRMLDECSVATYLYGLNSHNNYLGLSGHSFLNTSYKPVLQLNIPKGYKEIVVNVISNQSAIRKTFYLSDEKNQKEKDIKHAGLTSIKDKSGWSMSRQVYNLQKGQKKQISRDSLWCTVSLANIIQFAHIKGHKLPEWVSQWQTYSYQKKLQVYDKEVCHELNVYIKHQDKQFFNKVVQPFIKNKIIKTFVDMCLLEDQECLSYASSHKIRILNQFEKILLIQYLVLNGKQDLAKNIASSMELYQKSIKRSFQTYKQLFDIVLNSEASAPKFQPPRAPSFDLGNVAFGFSAPPMANLSATQFFSGKMMAPQNIMLNMSRMQEQQDQCNYDLMEMEKCSQVQEVKGDKRKKKRQKRVQSPRQFKPGFKQVQKTKQYTETTYAGMKNPKQSQSLIQPSLFWANLATHLVSQNASKSFLSEAFLYFTKPIQFTLACCFISNQPNADYQMNSEGQNFVVEANNSFMLFVKEVKQLDFTDKFGVLINQRFFDPDVRYTYEDDGTQIQKTVDEFLVKKPYTLQTVITNTSGTNLQLQILMDIPSNSIPLKSHEYVQILNVNLNSFSTTSFQRNFYFPSEGNSILYPANASRNNLVIAKAKTLPEIIVKTKPTINKLQSFSDVMRSGSKKQILDYIQKRNIFDSKIFSPYSILWMLNDKQFFKQVITILRNRNFYDNNIWSFGIYHKDYKCILQYIQANRAQHLRSLQIPIFEYFPYFSRRVHKFSDQNKSTIRNVQFKQTYQNFLINSLADCQFTSTEKVAFCYYLLLQDRIDQCSTLFSSISQTQRKAHQIQTDYLSCYLSMYQDYPNFTTAQKISSLYQNYPISSWRKLFKEVFDTLKQYKTQQVYEQNIAKNTVSQFKTTFVKQTDTIKLNVPSEARVEVYFYDINLEMYFSDYPFEQIQSLSVVKPKISKVFESGQSRQEKISYTEVQNLGNMIVQIYEFRDNVPAVKISSFFWANPKIKVKLIQNEGTLQVFYDGKKQSGCYVKVYSSGNKGNKFYRDGYTDITGKFKYALADLQGLTMFSILAITKQGGVISKIAPPSTTDYFGK